MKTIGFALLFAGLTVIGCGGSQKQNTATQPETSAQNTETDQSTQNDVDSQREVFIATCLQTVIAPEYCDCGFDQFKEIFKDDDLSKPLAQDDPRLATLKQQTIEMCSAKLPEDMMRDNFVKGCEGDDSRKNKYCTCAWKSLRKKMELTDFIGEVSQNPRFVEARKTMVVDCKKKFPEAIAKSDFMKSCTEDGTATEKSCACVWKKIRKTFSTEEIVAGVADLSQVKNLSKCK